MKINRAYVKKLEDLIVQLDAMLSDVEAADCKGYSARDMPALHKEADRIRDSRRVMKREGL